MLLPSIIIIVIAYILGSIPFGFIFSKISGKNVLEIGWKKTSGSNVFKNVGKVQGILTALFDVAKGYLAVYLADKFNFPLQIQALCGVSAVAGHNWSLFLKFNGGRGIGTFVGAFLFLSPQVLGFSLISLVLLALIWNASIGTILFLITAIILSIYFNQFASAGFFTIVSLTPIFIKRLSPIGDIKKKDKRSDLIKNRLIFDDDIPRFDFRINKIFKKSLTKD